MTSAPPVGTAPLPASAADDLPGAEPEDPTIAELTGLCELAAALADARSAVVNLLEGEHQHQIAAFGPDPTPGNRDDELGQAARADLLVTDASADPRLATSPWVDGRLARIRFYASIVLRSPAGHAIGTLCVFDDAVREPGPSQRHALALLARRVVGALELRRRNRELERANAELSRSQEHLAAFAGHVSHDLKAPLTAILGFTELLQEADPITSDPHTSEYLARSTSAAKRMLTMIDGLLAFARIGSSYAPRPLDLGELVAEAIADLDAPGEDVEVTWSGPAVLGDESLLHSLLRNLIGNSISYRGDEPLTVTISTEVDADCTVLRVADNGPGIPVGRRGELLRPTRKGVANTGLGLAISARIAAAHGGSLQLGETPGGGTTVTVRLAR